MLALVFISFAGVSGFGLQGPDEPRYASIGREMARSGDWVTPRLWGHAWFEKPALLYWMIGGAFKAGLGEDTAPRVPVAVVSIAFVLFYFLWLRREFNLFVGAVAAAVLATSAMWLGFSHAAVTDIPLTAAFAAAVLLLLPAVEGRSVSGIWAGALLGLSVLAKGLVPLVLVLPVLWFARRHWRLWLRPWNVAAFAAVALPWYVACAWRNGPEFLRVFFWEHQFGRFTSPALQHVQPFWFYLPWLLAALFPSVLLAGFGCVRFLYHDRRRQCLLATAIWGVVFFSVSKNKLPGYLLPMLPLVCILIAAGLDAARRFWPKPLAMTTAGSMLLLPFFMVIGGLLPKALGGDMRNAFPLDLITISRVADVMPIAITAALGSFFLGRERALALWFGLVCCGWVYVEYAALPWVDQTASARSVWRALPEPKRQFCAGPISRSWRYGLNYYAVIPLPECAAGEFGHAILPGVNAASRPIVR